MGTRRPMNRTPSRNGRYYDSHGSSNGNTSDSEDSNGSVYTPRADSRSYLLNVRPENRTTFCAIISQLTEETQPTFETTLKTKAVSEGSDTKFICIVTGYPEPEVTWYKDDEEMDRYCGLPKYEILRNGKRHTLLLYKCSEEDAAIYQASARNSKGIVSCSGVLEVGTMNEYKIHQRWFAKLKRKAEAKMREIEQSRRKVKENLDESERLRALSPERIQRKRRFSSEDKYAATETIDKEESVKFHVPDPSSRLQDDVTNTKEQPHNVVNGFHVIETEQREEVTTNGYNAPENIEENGKEFLAYVYETVELITKKPTPKESYAKKKKKEEEPSSSTTNLTKEETKQGTAKKTEGISPAPRRSRFGKIPVEEKMEVQTSPISVNKRFAPSILPNKSAKTAITKDLNKIKDNIVPSKKANDSFIPKPGRLQNKDEVNFSLKDMYFDNSLSQPKMTSPLDQVKKKKAEIHLDKSPANSSAEGQIKVPKAAPRRPKEQRELSIGRKPPPTTITKNELSLAKPVANLQQNATDPKPKCEPPKPVVDKSIGSSTLASGKMDDGAEQKQVESEVLVPTSDLYSEVESKKASTDASASPGERGELQGSEKTRMSLEDPNEEKTRLETLNKLQNLEMEYMALQKAYALLQKQLEISQKAEEAQKISKLSDAVQNNERTMIENNEGKNLDIQEISEKEINLMKCPSSPVPVCMQTDISTELEVIPDLTKTGQNGQSQTNQVMSSDSSMECSLEEDSNVKAGHIDDIQQMNAMKAVSEPIEDSREIRDVISEKVSIMVKDSSYDSKTKHVAHTSEVEMIEDVKEEVTKETIERMDDPIVEGIHVCSSSETAKASQKPNPVSMEKDIVLTSTVLHNIQTEVNISGIPDRGLNNDLSGDSLQLVPSEQNDQSVATLLRDVKKALESGVASGIGSSVDPASVHSPMTSPQAEGEYEAERIQIIPQAENKCSQELVVPDTTSTYQEETKTGTYVSSSGLSTTFPQDNHRGEHDNISKQKENQDHSLVTTLKNSLLMLLHIKTADVDKTDEKSQRNMGDVQPYSPEEMQSPQMSLSPPSPRKIYDYGKDSDSPQSIESIHSSSTSGKLSPASEEDMVQNVDSLQTSPTIPRRLTKISRREDIFQVESAPQSPVTPKRSSKDIPEKTVLSKEELSFSPATSRRIAAKIASGTDPPVALTVPSIVVGSLPAEQTLGSMLSDPQKDSNRKWRSTENVSLIPSATPEELASGARRKIYLIKTTQLGNEETGNTSSLTPPRKESPNVSPGLSRRNNPLLITQSPSVESRSPGTIRRMAMLDVPKIHEEDTNKGKTDFSSQEPKDVGHTSKDDTLPIETKKVNDPYKAPQLIRKIRAEQFSDASGNLKLWCQFFNILSDSNITWYKDEIQMAKVKRSSGDEGQVALAIVQASAKDCGVYQCTIENEYGSDSTDCLLSTETLSGFISKEEAEVGEEIEMTPMVFAKGLADSGYWGDKFFGRIVMEDPHVGKGFLRKSCRVNVIYGLEPMFESGKTCIIKIRNLITFGTKNESTLVEKNYDITIQDCKIQNTAREYCKIFAAECRGVPNFGKFPEILPLNLIYRPANNVPYATIEEDLDGTFEKYCIKDLSGKLYVKNSTEIEQKCCTFQHWVFQWTNGNFLASTLEGVGWKITNIGIATKSKGYQGIKESCYPEILEEFPSVHQCNSYCEMLGLKSLKANEGLQPPPKSKGSRSPQMGRKTGSAQSSPQMPKKAMSSPQTTRKGGVSPKSTRKAIETGDPQSGSKNKESEGLTIPKPQ